MKLFVEQNTNVLTSFLSLLGVKHTSTHANRYFNEHPYKYNLFGLSKMLTYYGVRNIGIKVENKKDIFSLDSPFIAHIGNDFVTVENISKNNVSYYWREKKLTIPTNEFTNIWTGIALIAEADSTSTEPDYKQHQKEQLIISIQKVLLLLAGIGLVGIGFWQNIIYQSLGLTLLLIFNVIGAFIGYLLVQKQVHIHSNMADKICSLFAKGDCNDVLNSPAAKFMGIIGWSELGFSYFLSNIFILLFTPHLISYLVLLNILALPYSFWSVWYQKFKAKTWCPLCLIVQLLFWILFTISVINGFIQTPKFSMSGFLSVSLIYGIPFLLINLLLPYLIESRRMTEITQQFNSLKMNESVFSAMLKRNSFYEVDKISSILLGNPQAKNTITILTNPHCGPCARMHKRIKKLLKDANNQFCVQYILSSFSNDLNSSCDFFLYINKVFSEEERDRIYDEWFDEGKYDRENFFRKHNFITDTNISEEFQRHLDWKDKAQLHETPTVLFNGYKLPEMFFQIEKLSFFTDLEIDPK